MHKKHDDAEENDTDTKAAHIKHKGKDNDPEDVRDDGGPEAEAAKKGLPHGPPRGKYDAHQTEVMDAKAREQRRVLRNREGKGDVDDEKAEGNKGNKATNGDEE